MARIYVASSWRNPYFPEVVTRLREAGHEVYDFRNPPHLHHPLAERQFQADIDALTWADTCVLVLPCGRSAHTEAGWMAGAGKRVLAYLPEMVEPELMYKLFDGVAGSLEELVEKLYVDRDVEFLRPGLSE